MIVIIQIHYTSGAGNKILQQGEFRIGKKKVEEVAFEFWKQIKRSLPYGGELEKVVAGDEDITEKVMELEKAPLDY